MRRTRKRASLPIESSDDEEAPEEKKPKVPEAKTKNTKISTNSESSSESDIENYLRPVHKIDLNSTFFNLQKNDDESMETVEKNIFSEVNRLSDSDSDLEEEKMIVADQQNTKNFNDDMPSSSQGVSKVNFQQLYEYTKKIEEARQQVELYKAKKQSEENNLDVNNILAMGECKLNNESMENDLNSHSESEIEDWEEIEGKEEKQLIPKEGVQITVEMPDTIRKKKGVDLLTALKRRLNRIAKENQVFVHQVHLLCYIAHGNFVNKILTDQTVLALALSLLPSKNSFPSNRLDLSYLEQFLRWYKKTIQLNEKMKSCLKLEEELKDNINNNVAKSKKMLVYIFICILRALGVHCRLVLSLQVEPLRPPVSRLHSVSTKVLNKNEDIENKDCIIADKSQLKTNNIKNEKNTETKGKNKISDGGECSIKTNSKATSKKAKPTKVDGNVSNETSKKSNKHTSKKKQTTETNKNNKSRLKSNSSQENLINSKKKERVIKTETEVKRTSKRKAEDHNKDKEQVSSRNSSKKSIENSKNKNKPASSSQEKIKIRSSSKESSSDSKEKHKPNLSKLKLSTKKSVKFEKNTVDQLDGIYDSTSEDSSCGFEGFSESSQESSCLICSCSSLNLSSSDFSFQINQYDGGDDSDTSIASSTKAKRPNLSKLKENISSPCPIKYHPKRMKSLPSYKESDSEDEFLPKNNPYGRITARSKNKKEKSSIEDSIPKKSKSAVPKRSRSETNIPKSHSSSPNKKPADVTKDIVNLVQKRIIEQKEVRQSRIIKGKKLKEDDEDYIPDVPKRTNQESDDEFCDKKSKKVSKSKVKERVKWKKEREANRNIISSDSEDGKKKKRGVDIWVEVFCEAEEKWISVDVIKGQLHCVNELYNRASHPVSYVLSWDNNNFVKDITKRYCPNWNTVTRKLRTDSKWWESSLKPFQGPITARDKEEDEELAKQQLEKPLPTTISEYKNHPLYALKRHLLKFEAIYPPEPLILGFVRKEPVYPRECVFTLHSRDIWLKQAKVVKLGEKPYKIVKARPKYDKLSNTVITDKELEIFGPWQVEDYVPPTAENGIVPRNAYGNVDLFKECMLPKGTVHLQYPGLNKVAKKMNIDCAPAMVGFDFHSGWSHPVYDGFVVCEEFSEALIAAWDVEQEEAEMRNREKVDKRVYGNWKKLIKGLLIRERLKARYNFGAAPLENSDSASTSGPVLTKRDTSEESD